MKLSQYKNEEALDILAEILEPVFEICQDKELGALYKEGKKLACVKRMLKHHKPSVLSVMAALERKTPQEYECNLFTLPMRLLEILSDPNIMTLFTSQSSTEEQGSVGSALENTAE